MYYFDDKQHHMPHIHVECGDESAVLAIPTGDILKGSLKAPKVRLVQARIEIHRDELMADWKLAINGEKLFRIEPLR